MAVVKETSFLEGIYIRVHVHRVASHADESAALASDAKRL